MARLVEQSVGILGRTEIERLVRSGWLLRAGTFDPALFRKAGYDARIAPDFCVTPDGTRFDYNQPPPSSVIVLKPGEMMLVSTMERLCLPPMFAAQIGVKFSYASSGLLVLTGNFVDPGFGLTQTEWNSWRRRDWSKPPRASNDAGTSGRLHFYLVNHSDTDYPVRLGVDKIITLQFSALYGAPSETFIPTGQVQDLRNQLGFDGPSDKVKPLRFGLLQSVERRLGELEQQRERDHTQFASLNKEIDMLRGGALPFIQLGLFLVSATLLGVVLNTLSSLSDSAALSKLGDVSDTLGGVNLGLIVLGSGIGLFSLST